MSRDAIVCPHCVAVLPKPQREATAEAPTPEVPEPTEAEYQATGPTVPLSSVLDEPAPLEQPASEKVTAGQPVTPPPPPPPPPAPPAPRDQPPYQPVAPMQQFNNAGFWPRVAALIIDGCVLAIPSGLLIAVVFLVTGIELDFESDQFGVALQLAQLPVALIEVAYFTLMNGTYGATLGKMALGMKIVRTDGRPIGYGLALGRIVVKLMLQNCTCSLFFLSVAINSEYRGWHDQIVGTRVIYVR